MFLYWIILLFVLWKINQEFLRGVARERISAPPFFKSSIVNSVTIQKGIVTLVGVLILASGFYLLQNYRDNTRYDYYRYYDYVPTNVIKTLSNGWEFLDQPDDDKKTIALAMNWRPPGHRWFFYPLLGRWLQNDIVYISAKYKWEVPAWLHKGILRGNDLSIWLSNIERNKVDYIFVMKPWPEPLKWMERNKNKFQLVFSQYDYKIYRYTDETT